MSIKRFLAEVMGTAVLVFVAVGVATFSFGFQFFGQSPAAGIVATALAFGLVLMALAYAIGPISGCHINPAVTLGFVAAGRMGFGEALSYWVAQFAGGALGAVTLWGMLQDSPHYTVAKEGLGTNGFGKNSFIGLNTGGAFLAEGVLTFLFVLVVLSATAKYAAPSVAGLVIGLTLTVVHLVGIPLTGTSVNPARSFGPALLVRGGSLHQLWLFIVAPLVGALVAAIVFRIFDSGDTAAAPEPAAASAA
jgi:aquaporin Z